MSATVRKPLKICIRIVAAAFIMFAATFAVYAAGSIPVLEQHVTADTVYLYLRHSGSEQTAEAQIGTDAVGSASVTDSDSVPVVTWLVLDNSRSYSAEDRNKAKELLTNLVAGRSANEAFTLCTYSDQLNVLIQDSQSYADLKNEIDAIEFDEHVSYLTDAISEILDIESSRGRIVYTRIVVICDGEDRNPGGLTREEINRYLDTNNVPIYTLGCETEGNDQLLKEVYSLSRQTGAKSWSLSGLTDTLEVVRVMSGEEMPVCVEIPIPERLRDGGIKGVKVTFGDGSVAETQLSMPIGEITGMPETAEPTPLPSSEPGLAPDSESEADPDSDPDSEFDLKDYLHWIIIAGGVLLLVLVIVVILLLRKKKEAERIRPVFGQMEWTPERTDIFPDPYQRPGVGGTAILVEESTHLMLSLTDRANPDRYFEVPLRGKVTIGRNNMNQIVLDYERSVSGTHCEIFVEGGIFKLRDLNSSNGTYIDGVRVIDVAEVMNGSTIKIGRLEFVVGIR